MAVSLDIELKVPYKITKRKKWYLINCPAFDVCTQGETKSIAKKNLVEALSLFLISCFERGTLFDVLRENGFKPYSPVELPSGRAFDTISVPLPLIASSKERISCHV